MNIAKYKRLSVRLFDVWTLQEYKFKNLNQVIKFVQNQYPEKKIYYTNFQKMTKGSRMSEDDDESFPKFAMQRYQTRYEDDPFDITYEDVLELISNAGSSLVFRNTQTQEVFYSNEPKKMIKFLKDKAFNLSILRIKARNGHRTIPNEPWEFRFTMDPFGWDQPPQLMEKIA